MIHELFITRYFFSRIFHTFTINVCYLNSRKANVKVYKAERLRKAEWIERWVESFLYRICWVIMVGPISWFWVKFDLIIGIIRRCRTLFWVHGKDIIEKSIYGYTKVLLSTVFESMHIHITLMLQIIKIITFSILMHDYN